MSDNEKLVAELARLIELADESDLTDGGRYFEDTCDDLTKCYHGDTGEYRHKADGELIELLWNNRHTILAALNRTPPTDGLAGEELQTQLVDYILALGNRGDSTEDALANPFVIEKFAALSQQRLDPATWQDEWPLGLRVTKTKGSSWTGRIVGYYSTHLTPKGVAIESETETGSVQIYPITAIRALKETNDG